MNKLTLQSCVVVSLEKTESNLVVFETAAPTIISLGNAWGFFVNPKNCSGNDTLVVPIQPQR